MFSNRIRKSGRWFWAACAAFVCVAIHGCGSGDLNSTARGTVAESSFEDSLDALSPNATKKITWEETGIKNLIAAQAGAGNTGTASIPPDSFNVAFDSFRIILGPEQDQPEFQASSNRFATLLDANGNDINNVASTNNFVPFSGTLNFVDTSGVMTIHFRTQDDSTARGLIHGFGVIMTDVEVGSKSGIRVFDKNGTFLEQKAALAAGNGESQFVSILRDQADIATVHIIMGDNSQGFGTVQDVSDGGTADLVVVDDLVFQASVTEAEYTFEVFSGVVTDNTGAADEAFGDFRRAVKATGVNSTNVDFDDADVTNHIANNGDDNTANFPQNGFVTSKALKFENEETNLFVTSDNFLDLNANHPLNFTAFSPAVQFKGIEKVTSVTFRRISSTPSFNGTDDGVDTLTAGFGAVFIDVEKANVSSLRYFDRSGGQILEQFVTAGTNNQKVFAGVIFNAAIVARVDMVMGEVPSVAQGIFGNEGVAGTANEDTITDGTGSLDLVSVDDCEFPDPTANLNPTDAGF